MYKQQTYIHMYKHTYIYMHKHKYICRHIHTHIQRHRSIGIYKPIYTRVHTLWLAIKHKYISQPLMYSLAKIK